MIELLAAALAMQASPAETLCLLDIKASGLSRAQRIVDADVGCPTDVADVDALASTAMALINRLDTNRLRHPDFLTADEVVFARDAAGRWQPAPGQVIVTVPFEYPDALIREGADRLACAWSASPDRNGRPRNVRVVCYVDGQVRPAYQIRRAEDAIEDMVRRTRFFPTDVEYCFQDEVRVVAPVLEVTGGRFNNDNDIDPDPRPLPQLCG